MNEKLKQEYERLIKEFKEAEDKLDIANGQYSNAFDNLEEFKAKYREELNEF